MDKCGTVAASKRGTARAEPMGSFGIYGRAAMEQPDHQSDGSLQRETEGHLHDDETTRPRPTGRPQKDAPGRCTTAHYLQTDGFFYALRDDINLARTRIWLAYFTVSIRPNRDTNPAARLLRLIADRAAAGVDVRLLIPPFRHVKSNRRTLADLQHTKILVHTTKDSRPLHLKFALIDSTALYISTHNLSRKSFDCNLEAAARLTSSHDITAAHNDYQRWWHSSRPRETRTC